MKYTPASVIVARLSRKYDANPAWIWDLLDAHFNMIKGLGCVMDPAEVEQLKELIEEGLEVRA